MGGNQTWTNNSASSLTANSTFNNGGFTLTADGTGLTAINGLISGSGGFVKNGPGRLHLKYESAANTHTGTTIINGGYLQQANHSGSIGSGNLIINSGNLAFYWGTGLTRTLGTGTNQVSIPGGESGFGGDSGSQNPTVNLGATIVWGAAGEGTATGHFNPSKFVLGNADAANAGSTTFSSAINLNGAARTILVPFGTNVSGNSATLSGVISNSTGTAALIKEGNGRLNLNAANTHNGGTTLLAGTIQLGNAAGLGSTSGQLTINGGLLNLNGQTDVTVGNLTGTGGTIANNASNARTFIIGSGNATGGLYQGVIADKTSGTGTIALTKSGTGSITLAGANSYTGTTSITAGKLIINGDQSSATGNVSVSANATLGGTGTLGGSTTIAAGGKLEFNLSTPAGSHNPLDLVSGRTLTFSGASVLTITSADGAAPGIYTLSTGGNNIGGVAPATLNLPANWAATVSISGNNLLLNVTSTGVVTDPYAVWAVGGAAFDGDANGDGVENGLAFLLGAATPTSAVTLPTVIQSGGALVMNFNMLKPANRGTATLSVQHSRDTGTADPWTTAPVPDSSGGPTDGVTFIVTPGGGTTNAVQSTIGSGEAGGTNKLFGRLKAHNP